MFHLRYCYRSTNNNMGYSVSNKYLLLAKGKTYYQFMEFLQCMLCGRLNEMRSFSNSKYSKKWVSRTVPKTLNRVSAFACLCLYFKIIFFFTSKESVPFKHDFLTFFFFFVTILVPINRSTWHFASFSTLALYIELLLISVVCIELD